jgi:hypothetical protein
LILLFRILVEKYLDNSKVMQRIYTSQCQLQNHQEHHRKKKQPKQSKLSNNFKKILMIATMEVTVKVVSQETQ